MGVRGKSSSPEHIGAANGDPNPAGRGEYDPETGISEFYDEEEEGAGLTLTDLWRHRDLIEADFHQCYGVDVDLAAPDASPVLVGRSWRWFLVRLRGLLALPETRLCLAVAPDPEPPTAPTSASAPAFDD